MSYPSSYKSSSSTTYAFKMLNNFKRGNCVIFMFISLVTFLRISTEKKICKHLMLVQGDFDDHTWTFLFLSNKPSVFVQTHFC